MMLSYKVTSMSVKEFIIATIIMFVAYFLLFLVLRNSMR